MAIWAGIDPGIKAALVGAAATFVVAIFGIGGLILQMRSQSRQARDAIAENERRKLKAEMYNDGIEVSRNLADAAIEMSTQLRTMSLQVIVAAQAASVNLGCQTPTARFAALLAQYQSFSNAVLRFIFLVENRRIIDPRILIFRTAMNSVLHDTRQLMHLDFVMHVMPSLPLESPDGKLFPYSPPAPGAAETIRVLSERFIGLLNDAISYTEDFVVELQNRLLGDLFATELSHRQPIDPNSKVITLDHADELERWFKTSSAWGQSVARIEAETRTAYGQQSTDD